MKRKRKPLTPEQMRAAVARAAKWKRANPEKVKASSHAYYVKNKATIKSRNNAWRKKNRDKVRAAYRRWAQKDPDHVRELGRASQRRHAQARRDSAKKSYRRHTAKRRAASRRWKQRHEQESRDYTSKWRRANRHRCRATDNKRRAKLRGATVGDMIAVRAFYKQVRSAVRVRCYWCNRRIPKGRRTVDHIIPIVKGGAHAAENLCAACKPCNSSKRHKLPSDFDAQRLLL